MAETLYADGVYGISILDGVVRLDLARLYAEPGSDAEKPESRQAGQLVLSPKGFLSLRSACDNLFKQMEERGLITQNTENVVAQK